MRLYDSKIWVSDLDEIVANTPEIEALANRRIMITGCTGLVCSAVVDILIRWNETHEEKIVILAAGRSARRIEDRFAPYCGADWFQVVNYDAASMDNGFIPPCDYIIHGASNASPNHIVKEPVETMVGNFMGVKLLLDHARQVGTKRLLYVSTSEVYGKKEHDRPSRVDEYGGIDILSPRSSYSVGKCAAETLCVSYYDEYGIDAVVVRPGHIYGPTASPSDNRVSSAWALAAAQGKDIVMKSDGMQLRSYCYCLDSAAAIIKVLLNGEAAHAYNISNPESIISIREMAELLVKHAGVQLKLETPTTAEKKAFNPMRNSSLDSAELMALGWKGLFDAERGFCHTVEILKAMNKTVTEAGK